MTFSLKLLAIFAKSYIVNVRLGSKNAFEFGKSPWKNVSNKSFSFRIFFVMIILIRCLVHNPLS